LENTACSYQVIAQRFKLDEGLVKWIPDDDFDMFSMPLEHFEESYELMVEATAQKPS